jgi:hypothetical protein
LLDKSEFQNMLAIIFSQLGQLEAATGGTPEAFFSLADSNKNEQVSFAELVTVFELEATRSKYVLPSPVLPGVHCLCGCCCVLLPSSPSTWVLY